MDEAFSSVFGISYPDGSSTPFASITIPSSIKTIGSKAFDNCFRLDNVTFEGDNVLLPASPNSPAFDGDLDDKYKDNGAGTYTRPDYRTLTWTKQ